MADFLQTLVRFVEPVLTGVFALLTILSVWYQRAPGTPLRLIARLTKSDGFQRLWVLAAFAVAVILGSTCEQASMWFVESTHLHDFLIAREYDAHPGELGIGNVCPHFEQRDKLRDYYGVLHLLPVGEKDAKPIDGLVTSRTYFGNNLVRTAAFIAGLGFIAFAPVLCSLISKTIQDAARRRKANRTGRPEPHSSPPASKEQRDGKHLGSAYAVVCVLCSLAYYEGEIAYHRSVRFAVVATLLERPSICERLHQGRSAATAATPAATVITSAQAAATTAPSPSPSAPPSARKLDDE